MKTASERPSLWHVIVPLAAMFYIYCFGSALSSTEHASGNNFTYHDPTLCDLNVAFIIAEGLAWFFLLADFIRQVCLFFGIKFK